MNNQIVIVLGASGSGKTTIFHAIEERETAYIPVCYTTRDCRNGEKEGNPYHLVSKETFEQLKQSGKIVFGYECHGNHYGIPDTITEAYKKKKNVFLGVSRKLIPLIKDKYSRVKIVYLDVDYYVLKKRLEERNREQPDEIKKRLEKSIELSAWAREHADYVIKNNGSVENALGSIDMLISYR